MNFPFFSSSSNFVSIVNRKGSSLNAPFLPHDEIYNNDNNSSNVVHSMERGHYYDGANTDNNQSYPKQIQSRDGGDVDSYGDVLSNSLGSQRGISLMHGNNSSTTNKIKGKNGKKHRPMKSSERNIWDTFMEHAAQPVNAGSTPNTNSSKTRDDGDGLERSDDNDVEEGDEDVVNIEESSNMSKLLQQQMSSTDHLENTLYVEMPMTVFVPSW
jgi:hypothetical protein